MAKIIGLRLVEATLAEPAKLSIRIYQLTRIFRPSCCRFYPSCSDYCLQAINTHGLVKGIAISLKRLAKCHPWHPGGVDMVFAEQKVLQRMQ